jgi:ribonuclease HI
VETLLIFKQWPQADAVKGKQVANYQTILYSENKQRRDQEDIAWNPPEQGRLKLNVDGSFTQHTGEAGAGMILRDHSGDVVFTACRSLLNCSSALEAELAACDEGIKLALNWSNEPIILELDCLEAVKMIQATQRDSSSLVHLVTSIKVSLEERDFQIKKIDRKQNGASHILAHMGRSANQTQFWIKSCPEKVQSCVDNDCKSVLS